MTKGKQHHLVPQGNIWAVERSGSKRASGIFETKQEAKDAGREISRNQGTEFVIHGKNGKIQSSDIMEMIRILLKTKYEVLEEISQAFRVRNQFLK